MDNNNMSITIDRQAFERKSDMSSWSNASSEEGKGSESGEVRPRRSSMDHLEAMVARECEALEAILTKIHFHPEKITSEKAMFQQLQRRSRTNELLVKMMSNMLENGCQIPNYTRYLDLTFELEEELCAMELKKEMENGTISAEHVARENERVQREQEEALRIYRERREASDNKKAPATINTKAPANMNETTTENMNKKKTTNAHASATPAPRSTRPVNSRASAAPVARLTRPRSTRPIEESPAPAQAVQRTPQRNTRSRSQISANAFVTPPTRRTVSPGCGRHTAERRESRVRRAAERRAQEEREAAEAREKVLKARRAAYNRALRKKASEVMPRVETGRLATSAVQSVSVCA